jgi:hypothetical protein
MSRCSRSSGHLSVVFCFALRFLFSLSSYRGLSEQILLPYVFDDTRGFLIHVLLAGRMSLILRVWAAPGASELIQQSGGASPPRLFGWFLHYPGPPRPPKSMISGWPKTHVLNTLEYAHARLWSPALSLGPSLPRRIIPNMRSWPRRFMLIFEGDGVLTTLASDIDNFEKLKTCTGTIAQAMTSQLFCA